jgi:hypothetical protein
MDGAAPLARETEADRPVHAAGEQVDDLPPDGRLAWLVDPLLKNVAETDQLGPEGLKRQRLAHLDPQDGVRPESPGRHPLEQGIDRCDDEAARRQRRLGQPP